MILLEEAVKSNKVRAKFGDDVVAKYGARIIYVKKGTVLFNIEYIFKIYSISLENKELPIYLDSMCLTHPKTVLLDKDVIAEIKVKKTKVGNTEEKRIYISTFSGIDYFKLKDKSDASYKYIPLIDK